MPYIPKPTRKPWIPETRPHQGRYERTDLYGSYRWKKERKIFLMHNPTCYRCWDEKQIVVEANVVDHHIPYNVGKKRHGEDFFWNQENWRPMCKRCHSVKSAKHDK